MSAHLFVDDGQDLGDQVSVSGADGHHLQRARRLSPGEDVTVADGRGRWRRYRIVAVGRGTLELEAGGASRVEPEPEYEIVAAPALVSRNRFDGLVAQLTEIGVDAIVPLVAERCVARWDRADPETVTTRLRAIAREAAMQSRRSRVPRVELPHTPSQLASLGARIVVASRDGARARDLDMRAPRGGALIIVSGPEGGLSDRDVAGLGAHECLHLGAFVLRAETAPVAAVAVLTQRRERCDGC